MTEAEWLECVSPQKMREHLESVAPSERKLRLFAAACCRRVARWFVGPRQSAALDELERYAEGQVSAEELERAGTADDAPDEWHDDLTDDENDVDTIDDTIDTRNAAYEAIGAVYQATASDPPGEGQPTYYHRLYDTITHVVAAAGYGAVAADRINGRILFAQAEERVALANLLRDIFGNPFRLPALDPTWRTSTAVAIAQNVYESRDFGAMPILADALQDAGCDDEELLAHCRDPKQVHVRGCWVVDAVLGKV
jgi:hypothetical protein